MTLDQIICGESASVLSRFADASADIVITDPPYLGRYRDRTGRTLANDDNPAAVLAVFDEVYRVLKPDSYCISFYGWTAIHQFASKWWEIGFRPVSHIVWPKGYTSKTSHTQYCHESAYVLAKGRPEKPQLPITDVQQWAYTGNRQHPTEKAVSVIAPLVRAFSKPGDLVLDPFSGSGTTAVAAALNDRRYIGIELDSRYCDLARKRLEGVQRWQSQAA